VSDRAGSPSEVSTLSPRASHMSRQATTTLSSDPPHPDAGLGDTSALSWGVAVSTRYKGVMTDAAGSRSCIA
jgi:hypothetical protein